MNLPPVDLSAVKPCLSCHGLGRVRILGTLLPCPMCASPNPSGGDER